MAAGSVEDRQRCRHRQVRGVVRRSLSSDEKIVGFLREAELGTKTVEQLAREHGFSQNSFYVWKRKFGAMSEPDVKRARELEKENFRLKRLLAERDGSGFAYPIEIDVMNEVFEKKAPLVSERRKLVECFERRDVPVSRACELLSICRRRLGWFWALNQEPVRAAGTSKQETYMPLVFDPGEEAQVDWGEATIIEIDLSA
jgi:putative transposase